MNNFSLKIFFIVDFMFFFLVVFYDISTKKYLIHKILFPINYAYIEHLHKRNIANYSISYLFY